MYSRLILHLVVAIPVRIFEVSLLFGSGVEKAITEKAETMGVLSKTASNQR